MIFSQREIIIYVAWNKKILRLGEFKKYQVKARHIFFFHSRISKTLYCAICIANPHMEHMVHNIAHMYLTLGLFPHMGYLAEWYFPQAHLGDFELYGL